MTEPIPDRIYWCPTCRAGVGVWTLLDGPPRCPGCQQEPGMEPTAYLPAAGGYLPPGKQWKPGEEKLVFQHASDEALIAYLEGAGITGGDRTADVRDGWRAGVTWLLSVLTGVEDNPVEMVRVGPVPADKTLVCRPCYRRMNHDEGRSPDAGRDDAWVPRCGMCGHAHVG